MRLDQLQLTGRAPALPLQLELGGEPLVLEHLLRVLPGQRYVGLARWRGRLVLAKLLVGGKAERHFQRELSGARLLAEQGLCTPELLAEGFVAGQGGWLLFDYLEGAESLWDVLQAKVVREVPGASAELPSMALALQGGGQIGLDPEASAEGKAPKALEPLFQFELQFTGSVQPRYLGGRVHVRFSHSPAPLGEQWYRGLRQQFMKRFAV